MSDRRQVRVRRSPRIGVFLGLGAVIGAIVAIVAVNVTPADPTVPTIQAIGFLVLLLAPVGALVSGVVALLIDARSDRRARTMEAERIAPAASQETPRLDENAALRAEDRDSTTP